MTPQERSDAVLRAIHHRVGQLTEHRTPAVAIRALGDLAIAALQSDLDTADELQALFEQQRKREAPWVAAWQQDTGKHHTLPDYGEFLGWLIDRVDAAKAAGGMT